jgi:hypothetical protein
MISLEITHGSAVDASRLFLVKGRKVTVCQSCQKSFQRTSIFCCQDCRGEYCRDCVNLCRCHVRPQLRFSFVFWKRQGGQRPAPRLAVVGGAQRAGSGAL